MIAEVEGWVEDEGGVMDGGAGGGFKRRGWRDWWRIPEKWLVGGFVGGEEEEEVVVGGDGGWG